MLQLEVKHLRTEMNQLTDESIDLEGRPRRQNIQIAMLREGTRERYRTEWICLAAPERCVVSGWITASGLRSYSSTKAPRRPRTSSGVGGKTPLLPWRYNDSLKGCNSEGPHLPGAKDPHLPWLHPRDHKTQSSILMASEDFFVTSPVFGMDFYTLHSWGCLSEDQKRCSQMWRKLRNSQNSTLAEWRWCSGHVMQMRSNRIW